MMSLAGWYGITPRGGMSHMGEHMLGDKTDLIPEWIDVPKRPPRSPWPARIEMALYTLGLVAVAAITGWSLARWVG